MLRRNPLVLNTAGVAIPLKRGVAHPRRGGVHGTFLCNLLSYCRQPPRSA
jgi:hypothetical protein